MHNKCHCTAFERDIVQATAHWINDTNVKSIQFQPLEKMCNYGSDGGSADTGSYYIFIIGHGKCAIELLYCSLTMDYYALFGGCCHFRCSQPLRYYLWWQNAPTTNASQPGNLVAHIHLDLLWIFRLLCKTWMHPHTHARVQENKFRHRNYDNTNSFMQIVLSSFVFRFVICFVYLLVFIRSGLFFLFMRVEEIKWLNGKRDGNKVKATMSQCMYESVHAPRVYENVRVPKQKST